MEFKTFQTSSAGHVLRIKAPQQQSQQQRQPVHFIALVDTSGSMGGEDRLTNVITSLTFMLDHLTPADYLTVITFSAGASLAIPTTQLTPAAKAAIIQTLQGLSATGNTNLSAAILLARDAPLSLPGVKTGILILTDGQANAGLTSEADLAALLVPIGVTVHTIGYGMDHNSTLLTQVAIATGGAYNVVTGAEDTAACIGDIVGGLLTCVAQNVAVEYPPGTTFQTSYAVSEGRVIIGDILAESDTYIISSAAPLEIRGHLLPAGTAFTTAPTAAAATPEELLEATVASIRHEVAGFLRDAAAGRAGVIAATSLRARIEAMQAAAHHPIWQILLDQLAEVEHSSAAAMTPDRTTIFHQRATSIGIGRGLISGTVASPFANQTQRHISTQISSEVSQCHDTDPVAAHSTK
jgi:hypothetical protein